MKNASLSILFCILLLLLLLAIQKGEPTKEEEFRGICLALYGAGNACNL